MKNLKFVMLTIVAVVLIGVYGNAQEKAVKEKATEAAESTTFVPGKYVDEDQDGVCDNHEVYHKNGKGVNYVDENEDGVCDNYTTHHKNGYGKGRHHGHGYGYRHGHRHGNGYGYHHRYSNE